MAALTLAALLAMGTAWWQVPTDSDTTAEVRATFVARLREHRRDVREHKAELAELRRLAEQAAAAAAAAEAALDAVPASSSGGCLSDAQIAAYARGAGFPESVIPTMVYIAAHRNGTGESGGCPGAINPSSGACGLWQIYPPQYGCTDPAQNAAMAFAKYQAAGLSPWGG
jgi:hypothetical protein